MLTLRGAPGPRRGDDLKELGIIPDGALLVADGVVQEVGPSRRVENLTKARNALEINAAGRVVMPGFVDSHTHLVCPSRGTGDDRHKDVARVLRTSSTRRLAGRARAYLESMARHGTTTVEVKAGGGLDEGSQIKLLRSLGQLKDHPINVVPTLLLRLPDPKLYSDNLMEEIVDGVCRALLVKIARRRLARYVEVVLDGSPGHRPLLARLVEAAAQAGFPCKLRCAPNTAGFALSLAVGRAVVGVNQLDCPSPEQAKMMADLGLMATLLPSYGSPVHHEPGSARALIDAGVPIALASNFSPPQIPTLNMQTIVSLAGVQLGLTTAEAICAATINGAHASGCNHRAGSLEIGKTADLLILNIPDYRDLAHQFGMNLVHMTMKSGGFIYREGEVVPLGAHNFALPVGPRQPPASRS